MARVRAPVMLAAIGLLGCGLVAATEPLASPSAVPVKHNSLKACTAQADTKKLSGAARSQFVKRCQTETVSTHALPAAATAPTQAGK